METLAYFHLASAYEDSPDKELVCLNGLLEKANWVNWKRLSSWAWRYMLPLAITLSVLSVASSALALQKGDSGPAVRNLQEQLRKAGFYRATINELYDPKTEDAVRKFQAANGLVVDGIAGPNTLYKLQSLARPATNSRPRKSTTQNSQPRKPSSNGTFLRLGDSGTPVRNLQQQLTRVGFYKAAITGQYDSRTDAAVRQFQTAHGLLVDGIAGPNTLSKLQSLRGSVANQRPRTTTAQNSRPRTTSNRNSLQRGDSGPAVKTLQEQLRVAGFFSANSTGFFGPITEDAVRKFQAANGLAVNGIVEPPTLQKLPPVGVGFGEPTPTVANTSRDSLRLGDSGQEVRMLQQQLKQVGFFPANPTGFFGPITEDAVRRFQAANYLSASGIAGPTTRGKLVSYVPAAPTPASQSSVLDLQRRLQQRGFYDGSVNGVMDDKTKEAITEAQRYYGVSLNDIQSGRF